ncbi:hypothetical protein FISHEDRAFT_55372 [Fistulina hepatica ATCC 64428]|uniref:F-box domain-containing protein n=1 Tax=Fistulina hepatica ATCC 64428 TaxID=1128425 RepID=A0A0D7AR75_9AGAR|nr:hypothetical protein FISHEDRAFT_55372 [Fistulina hepatica ATCC 64428]
MAVVIPQVGSRKKDFSALPPELLDEVFSHLHSDKATLRACSLVSSNWLLNSRRHLFYHLQLRVDSFSSFFFFAADQAYDELLSSYSSLLNFLTSHPDITRLIRQISIQIDVQRTELVNVICDILHCIPTLKVLEIEVLMLLWNELSPRFRDCVRDVLRLPSLVEFHLSCESISQRSLDSLLSDAHSLKTCTLTRVSIAPDRAVFLPERDVSYSESVLPPLNHKAHLDSLHLLGSPVSGCSWFLHPECPLDLAGVRELVLGVRLDEVYPFELVETLGHSLERLVLDVSHSASGQLRLPHIDMLTKLPHLRSLELNNLYGGNDWVVELLRSTEVATPSSAVSSLEDITISLSGTPLEAESWKQLDAILTQPMFGSLKQLSIQFAEDFRHTAQSVPPLAALEERGVHVDVTFHHT